MIHKGENYNVKMQKYYFCNGTIDNYIRKYTHSLLLKSYLNNYLGTFMK